MRSSLFVPGDSERKLSKSLGCGADVLFIDLEDSVSLDNKPLAREITQDFLNTHQSALERPRLFVRVNSFDTELLNDDLSAVMAGRPDGIVLPKSEHGQDVTRLDGILRVHEAQNGLDDGVTEIVAIITETAIGALNAGTYRRSSKRLSAVSWGAEDLSADIGAIRRRDAEGTYTDVFRFARMQTLLGAIAANVDPMDTVYPDFSDETGFRLECEAAMADGFTGKMAIHPAQVPIINEVFTPSETAVQQAREIVDAFEAAGNPGVVSHKGSMLDRPHLLKAQKLLQRSANISG